MAIDSIKAMCDAELQGRVRQYTWRRNIVVTNNARIWFDLNMSSGNPSPKYWFDAPPMIAKAVSQSGDGGIFHGANVSPYKKYLRTWTNSAYGTVTGLPMQLMLLDYLVYYPSIDESIVGDQALGNPEGLPRYTDGKGVQVIAVTVAARNGGWTFTLNYTNQDGVSGRVSPPIRQNAATAVGSISTSLEASVNTGNPFLPLADGDYGVRSIESINFAGSDFGLTTLILVKPLATTTIYNTSAAFEKDLFLHNCTLPVIQDDAFLGLICLPNNSIAAQIYAGNLKFIWG